MKKTVLIASLVAISTLLTACETREPIYGWTKKGVSITKTENEELKCQTEAYKKKSKKMSPEQQIDLCMKKKGFTWGITNR